MYRYEISRIGKRTTYRSKGDPYFTKVYVPKNINLKLKTKLKGELKPRTNYERMKDGNAPIGPDGQPMEMHHIFQKEPGTHVVLPDSVHSGNYGKLHKKIDKSFRKNEIRDKQYNGFRKHAWKQIYLKLKEEYAKNHTKI